MTSMRRAGEKQRGRWPLLVILALASLAASCRGGEQPAVGGLSDLGDLRGRTVGIASLEGVSALELRYVLQESHGLDMRLEGGDVTIEEAPAESLAGLLGKGDIDAAVMTQLGAFRLLEDDGFRVLSHIAEEMRGLTGAPILNSILVTYPDVAEQRGEALGEVNRLLAESVAYFRANREAVIEAVAAEEGVDREFLRWQSERQELPLGDLSPEAQEGLRDVWEAAKALGDIEGYLDLAGVLFRPRVQEQRAEAMAGDRVTVSLALLDDPSRRAALYAIEQGIVASDTVDLDLTYLAQTALLEAAPARQYDVIEAMPLMVPSGAARGLDFVVLSAGLLDLDGTLLFVRNEPAGG